MILGLGFAVLTAWGNLDMNCSYLNLVLHSFLSDTHGWS